MNVTVLGRWFKSTPHLKSYGFDTLNRKDKLGSDPSLWKLVGCDSDSNLTIKAKYKQSREKSL